MSEVNDENDDSLFNELLNYIFSPSSIAQDLFDTLNTIAEKKCVNHTYTPTCSTFIENDEIVSLTHLIEDYDYYGHQYIDHKIKISTNVEITDSAYKNVKNIVSKYFISMGFIERGKALCHDNKILVSLYKNERNIIILITNNISISTM